MPKLRLDKLLASQGLGSRKDVQKLIRGGAVAVNGEIERSVEHKADPQADVITVEGQPLAYKEYLYLMMNKPAGVVSASNDAKERTVVDLVPQPLRRRGLFPAGRLDRDTTGLLILTDDGDFAHRMLAPKKHVYKLYQAELEGSLPPDAESAFAAGITLNDGTLCLPARLEVVSPFPPVRARVWIREGKFHQVKKMFLSQGCRVTGLKRLQIGGLCLDPALGPGECRELSAQEVASIFH